MTMNWIVLLLSLVGFAHSDSVSSKIYMTLDNGFKTCFRRLNATHSIGCSSDMNGNVGTVYMMMDEKAADSFTTYPDSPYILVMSMKVFVNKQRMETLNVNKHVVGIAVIEPRNASERPSNFSVDSRCPNAHNGLYSPQKQCSAADWNTAGLDYFYKSWNFPIILLSRSENASLDRIIQCYEKFNTGKTDDDRRCSLQISTPMSGVQNSRVCLRRTFLNNIIVVLSRFCDEMVGTNLHYAFGPQVRDTDRNTIFVTARTDSMSLFTDGGFGSFSVYPAVAIVVALADAFSKISTTPQKRIIFSLLNGESTQYMGSSRLVYDMEQNIFMKEVLGNATELRHIHSVIELGQLGSGAIDGQYYIHTASGSKTPSVDSKWISKFQTSAKSAGIKLGSEKGSVLPPSSIQSFLKGSDKIAAVLVSDYKSSYSSLLYHSIFDDEKTVATKNLYKLAKATYDSLYQEVFGSSPKTDLNESRFVEITDCFYNVSGCQLLTEAFEYKRPLRFSSPTPLMDATLRGDIYRATFATVANYLLFYMSGQIVPKTTKDNCKAANSKLPKYSYRYITGPNSNITTGVCWRALMTESNIDAPNIKNFFEPWNTTRFPFWTESNWVGLQVRLFLRPSKAWETIVLSLGIIVTLLSLILVLLVRRYAEDIFPGLFYTPGTTST